MKLRKGPPDLALFETPDALRAQGRFALETVWNNEGGPGRGLLVTLSGPAIRQGRVRALEAVLGPVGKQRRVALEAGEVDGDPVVFAAASDWEVRPGVVVPDGRVSEAELAALGEAMLAVVIEGEVAAAGRTTLHLLVSVEGAAEGDLATVALDLETP